MIIRIRFLTKEDRIKGSYVLITNTVSRRLRGDIFEIADKDRKILDDHQLHYEIVPVAESDGSDSAIRIPPPYEVQRRNGD